MTRAASPAADPAAGPAVNPAHGTPTGPPAAPDPHRPAVHQRPPRNWINDPNGPVFHDGRYHMFFQHNPQAPVHADVHWGHASSPDLLRWTDHPVALAPTPGGDDADGCFSGNTLSLGDRLVAFYSAYRGDRWWQPVARAESTDGGLTWRKLPGLAVPEAPDGVTVFRDPYVWRHGDGYRMLVGAGFDDGQGAALLYESADLDRWTYRGPLHRRGHEPVAGGPDTGVMWECPQYVTIGDLGLLIVSAWYEGGGPSHVVAFTGPETDGRLAAGSPFLLDHGPDFYAPALMRAPDGRVLLWGWSWEGRQDDWARQAGWAGVLTLPREVTLTPDGRAHQAPAREIATLRRPAPDARRLAGHGLTPGAEEPLGEVGGSFELLARVTVREDAGCRLRLVTDEEGGRAREYLDLTLLDGALLVDRDHASLDGRARGGGYRLPCPEAVPGGTVELRIVVDGSIVEVYTGSGRTLTLRCYPTGIPPWRLYARGVGAGECLLDVETWTLAAPGGEEDGGLGR
ncbi:glycoside hydrolase family 32 protein [Allostreptomyces psammosilenae]|uniref:beta-fructofuranosidase n=1 Tax=Allostreptomyces psammosilenae TaxID=1892865 RepID=A0A852ZTI6_9ACTN|nr:glycoside hydrolase family 32 protein [Allostreptomyces psammosilenae]NYI05165.1 beta-fructofuranosidase [Allostreptomyces psammosilenae]